MAAVALVGGARASARGTTDARQACQTDYRTYCSGVQPGGGRIKMCLQRNAARLSPGCQQALGRAKASNGG